VCFRYRSNSLYFRSQRVRSQLSESHAKPTHSLALSVNPGGSITKLALEIRVARTELSRKRNRIIHAANGSAAIFVVRYTVTTSKVSDYCFATAEIP
jgi:hypothetical protein